MNTLKLHKLGIDIGSTTVKIAILDEQNTLVFSDYERHFANIRETLTDLLHKAYEKLGQIQLWSDTGQTPRCSFCTGGYRRIYRSAGRSSADRRSHRTWW